MKILTILIFERLFRPALRGFVVRADEKLTAFLELEAATRRNYSHSGSASKQK
jgi:hypothetical protein